MMYLLGQFHHAVWVIDDEFEIVPALAVRNEPQILRVKHSPLHGQWPRSTNLIDGHNIATEQLVQLPHCFQHIF